MDIIFLLLSFSFVVFLFDVWITTLFLLYTFLPVLLSCHYYMFTCSSLPLFPSRFLVWLWYLRNSYSRLLFPTMRRTFLAALFQSSCILFWYHTWVTDAAAPARHHITTRQGLHHPPHHLLPQAAGVHSTRGPTLAAGYVQQQVSQRYVLAVSFWPPLVPSTSDSVTGYWCRRVLMSGLLFMTFDAIPLLTHEQYFHVLSFWR